MSPQSKRFHVTLPELEGQEIEQVAAERKVPPAQIIRERLQEWQNLKDPSANADVQVPQFNVDPRIDLILNLLQPIERRLQRLDEQCLTLQEIDSTLLSEQREQNFFVQAHLQKLFQEDIPAAPVDLPLFLKRMERLEIYFSAVLELLGQIFLDVAPPDTVQVQAVDLKSVQTQLNEYLNRTL